MGQVLVALHIAYLDLAKVQSLLGPTLQVYVLGSTVVMVKRSSLQLAPAVPGCCAGARTAATAAVPAAAAATAAKHCNAVAQQPSILAAEEAQAAGPPEPCLRNGSAAAGPATCALHADARVPGQPAAAATAGRCMLAAQLPTPSPPEALGEAPLDLELVERVSAYPAAKSWGKWDLAPKVRSGGVCWVCARERWWWGGGGVSDSGCLRICGY